MDWLMTVEVIGGVVLAFAVALAAGFWLSDVQPPPSNFDPPPDRP